MTSAGIVVYKLTVHVPTSLLPDAVFWVLRIQRKAVFDLNRGL